MNGQEWGEKKGRKETRQEGGRRPPAGEEIPKETHQTNQFFAPRGQTEGAWAPLSLVEGMVHPHSQERDHMNHLLQPDRAFTEVK